jgi:hypothetical protein
VRRLIRRLDGFLRGAYGVFEFSDSQDFILRLQVASISHPLSFSDDTIPAGEKVLVLHVWNEHMLPMPPGGADLGWTKKMFQAFLKSLGEAADYIKSEPAIRDVRAVGGTTVLLFSGDRSSGARFIEKLGFTIMPYSNPSGRFGEFWENFYSWMLMWTYNPGSVRYRHVMGFKRAEFWMPIEEFVERYG